MTEIRLFTIPEALARMDCTAFCLRSWIWSGQLAYVRAGERYLVDVTDLEKLIQRPKRRERS